ncbi:hypothetical protein M8C13_18030 [Crossiella sp. SN42]|uniref:hypothetical protein n=1 Tax=Crossiella sp. SN42 TaxID=2944808 RepID=UPI00207D41C6|nr:hypothetical protein [Crossiella sp. SN42]MCO1577658.1 hypothetical protein [Crossiella sp. SN42]
MSANEIDPSGITRRVRRLQDQLAESRQLHGLSSDPLLNAVKVERLRVSITRCMWFFLTLGLGFTTVGVHDFLAGALTMADPLWWGAWLAEPGLAGILITLLRWEAEMLARGVAVAAKAVSRLKRLLLTATLVMNVWSVLFPAKGTVNHGMLVLHIVIPAVVYLVAEVMPVIQQTCATARSLVSPSPSQAPEAETTTQPPAARDQLVPALRLPQHMMDALSAKQAEAEAAGRALTAQDIQDGLRVSEDYAARILSVLTPAGHPAAA